MAEEMSEELKSALADLEALQGKTEWPTDRVIDGFRLVCTCPACPEQYDVHMPDGQKAGYLRLRHGWFRADVPVCGGETIYEAHPKGDGIFNDDERESELTKAIAAIKKWWEELSNREPG